MRVKIYQINSDRDSQSLKFINFDGLMKENGVVDASIYDEVFNAEIEEETLEDIYCRFNREGHPLFRGHSLSVSDVVVKDGGAYFCDSVGFKKITFDEKMTQKPDDLLRVLYVEPHKAPYEAEICSSLEGLQKAVGGLIEPIYNEDGETCLVGNEEAKLIGMEGNRRIRGGASIIAGPFFVCGLTEDDFRSLTDEEMAKYSECFAQPEDISQEEVRSDMGFFVFGFQ